MGSGKKPFCLAPRWIVWIVASGCGVMGCGNVYGELWFLGMSRGGEFPWWVGRSRSWRGSSWRVVTLAGPAVRVPGGERSGGMRGESSGIYDLRSRD